MSYIGLTLRPEQMAWFIYRNIAWSVSVAIHAFGRQSLVWLKLLRCHGGRGNNIINIDVFAATSIVTLYVTVKVQSMQRACASLATSCQLCSDSFISKLNTRAMLGFVCLKVKYPSSGRIRASQR